MEQKDILEQVKLELIRRHLCRSGSDFSVNWLACNRSYMADPKRRRDRANPAVLLNLIASIWSTEVVALADEVLATQSGDNVRIRGVLHPRKHLEILSCESAGRDVRALDQLHELV